MERRKSFEYCFCKFYQGKSKSKNGRKDAEEIVMVSALKGMEGLFSKDK